MYKCVIKFTCGGEHSTALHHLATELSQTHRVQVSGPGI